MLQQKHSERYAKQQIESVIFGESHVALLHGDCFDFLPLIPQASTRLVISDPPYNVSKAGGRYGFKGKKFVANKWDTIDDYSLFSTQWMNLCRDILFDNGTMYVWCYYRSIPFLPLRDWYPLNLIIYRKRNAFPTTMQNSIWSPSCEYAYFLRKTSGKDHVFHIGKDDFARDFFDGTVVTNKRHPTEKPYELIYEFIRRSSNVGDIVVDPFMGSNTTGDACVTLGRKYIGIELDDEYFRVSRERIE